MMGSGYFSIGGFRGRNLKARLNGKLQPRKLRPCRRRSRVVLTSPDNPGGQIKAAKSRTG